jgi:hypothetical protein
MRSMFWVAGLGLATAAMLAAGACGEDASNLGDCRVPGTQNCPSAGAACAR